MTNKLFEQFIEEMRITRQVNEAMLAELRAIRSALPRPIKDEKGAELLRALEEKYGTFGFISAEVTLDSEFAEADSKESRLAKALASVCGGQINSRVLGVWLARHEGEIMEGRTIIRARKRGAAGVRWQVRKSDSG